MLARACRRPDRADRRTRRPAQPPDRRRPARRGRRAAGPARGDFRRPALCRTAAPRPGRGTRRRRQADRARLRARRCRWSPPTTCISAARTCTRRMTRCSASPMAPSSAQDDRRRLTREHRFKTAGRDGGAIRRSARGDREHARDRAPLRLPPQEARSDPAAIRARIRPHAGRRNARAGRSRAWQQRLARARPATPRNRSIATGWNSSSTSSSGWISRATS